MRAMKASTTEVATTAHNYQALVRAIEMNSVAGRHRASVQIQTVSACNAKCHFCPYLESWHKKNPGRMEEDTFRRVVHEIANFKIMKFCPYLENEPLMDKDLFNRIEYALQRIDFKTVELSTNAFLLSQAKIDNLERIFKKVPHEIRISFHGSSKESFEKIMGLDYQRCLSNILALIDKSQNAELCIRIIGAGAPKLDSDRYPHWFDNNDYTKFWNSQFRKHGFKKLPTLQFLAYHDRAGSISRNEINFSGHVERALEGFYCRRIDQWLHFLYTGEMILCCMDYHKQTAFGNINKAGLKEILKSERYLDMARIATGQKKAPDNFICRKCISPGG
jgi:sulfatase maturation enzyme AslB (radical SAM superfamily)